MFVVDICRRHCDSNIVQIKTCIHLIRTSKCVCLIIPHDANTAVAVGMYWMHKAHLSCSVKTIFLIVVLALLSNWDYFTIQLYDRRDSYTLHNSKQLESKVLICSISLLLVNLPKHLFYNTTVRCSKFDLIINSSRQM